MNKFNELPLRAQVAMMVALAVGLSAAFYFFELKRIADENKTARATLKAKQKENAELRPYRDQEKQLEQKIATLQQQLAILKQIVPDDKEADQFMHVMQNTASESGIEIRRYASKPIATKEFYTEAPFDIELDGPYYSMLNFFDRVGRLERIINISNLQLASVKRPTDAKVKKTYQYAPGESTVATCVATTFFSHDPAPAKPAAPARPAPPAQKGK